MWVTKWVAIRVGDHLGGASPADDGRERVVPLAIAAE